jgi:hypothetical protein
MNHRKVMKKLLENFSDEEIKHLYRGDNFHRDFAEKFVAGVDFLWLGEKVEHPKFTRRRKSYTEIHPKIKIGDVEVNAPYRVKPEYATTYWVVTYDGNVESFLSSGDHADNCFFNYGNCFKTKDDARAASDAIRKLLKGDLCH